MIKIRNAQESDLDKIAQVHVKCFPNYFLTSLGSQLIARLYECYLETNNPLLVATDEENNIIGFCTGAVNTGDINAIFESKNKFRLIKKLFVRCLVLDKASIKRIYLKIKSMLKYKKSSKQHIQQNTVQTTFGIASICVLNSYRGTKLASDLISQYENQVAKRGFIHMSLSVLKDNARAIAFYEKCGYKRISQHGDSYVYTKDIAIKTHAE